MLHISWSLPAVPLVGASITDSAAATTKHNSYFTHKQPGLPGAGEGL